MTGAVSSLRAAIVFLTRLPVGSHGLTEASFRWSTAHFPVVGALLGLIYAGAWFLLEGAGPFVAATAVVALTLMVTGAFHEDGLADTADGLGGSFDRERALTIMKDSRVGTFGAAALILALLMKVQLLGRLGPGAPVALIATEAASRLPPVWLMALLPYATASDRAKSRDVARAGAIHGAVASAWSALVLGALVLAGVLSPLRAGLVAGVPFLAAAYVGLRGWRRLRGVTGDLLGAAQQLGQLAALLALVLVTP